MGASPATTSESRRTPRKSTPDGGLPVRRAIGYGSAFYCDFFLEVSGERLALWTRKSVSFGDAPDPAELRRILKASHYAFQPITVILHPPTVCIKTFRLEGMTAPEWLTDHLHEVFPPGDRRQMRLVYATCRPDQLVVAVTNRAALHSIAQLIWQAGGSIAAIVPAPALDLAEPTLIHDGRSSTWNLVTYHYEQKGIDLSIWPSCVIPEEASTHSTLCGSPPVAVRYRRQTKAPLLQQLDFLPQLKIPRPIPTRFISQSLRASSVVTAILLALVTVFCLAGAAYRSATTKNTERLTTLGSRVTQLQEHDRELKRQLNDMTSEYRGKPGVGRVLYTIASSTPENVWLRQLELQRTSDNGGYDLRANGLASDNTGPSSFATALDRSQLFAEAHLVRVSRINESVRGLSGGAPPGKIIEFDLQGRTVDID